MASFNRVILLGNITRDIELKATNSGLSVTELGLAVNDRRKNASGEWVEETTFVDVTLWGKTAEIARDYLSKGSPILIEGRLKLDTWESEGQKRSKLRVVGERMQMLGRAGQGGSSGSHQGSSDGHDYHPNQGQNQSQYQNQNQNAVAGAVGQGYRADGSHADSPSGPSERQPVASQTVASPTSGDDIPF